MKRLAQLATALLTTALLLLAGCRAAGTAAPSGTAAPRSPYPSASSASGAPAATGTPAVESPPPVAAPAGYPDDGPDGLLASIRTEKYAGHDRVVFQFHGRSTPAASVDYRHEITTDAADTSVPLSGSAFVHLAFHNARLDTAPVVSDPSKAQRYTGPTRLAPNYPILRELATAGDFEGVLSFGLGLSTVSGLSVITSPGSYALDLWSTAPSSLLWPVTSVSQAQDLQHGTESGHQPWTLSALEVATHYVHEVLGWSASEGSMAGPRVYQFTAGNRTAVVTLRQPLDRTGTVWVVAAVVSYAP